MFNDLLEELDALGDAERKSACLRALQKCSLAIENLSNRIERERRQVLATLIAGGREEDIQVLMGRSLRRCLEEFEMTEDVDALAASLANFASRDPHVSHRGITRSRIKDVCNEYKRVIRPMSRKYRAILDLANQITFRLYEVGPLEAEQIRNELKAWNP